MTPKRIDLVFGFEHGLPPIFGIAAAVGSIAFLLFGLRLHRITIGLVGFFIGAFIGQLIARWALLDSAWGILVGGAAFALLSDPLYRLMVFLLAGGALGIVMGETVRVLFYSQGFLWGFIPGFLFGGVLSLWQLRWLVVFSTSALGAVGLWWGIAVTLRELFPQLVGFHSTHPWVTGVLLFATFLSGFAFQVRFCLLPPAQKGQLYGT